MIVLSYAVHYVNGQLFMARYDMHALIMVPVHGMIPLPLPLAVAGFHVGPNPASLSFSTVLFDGPGVSTGFVLLLCSDGASGSASMMWGAKASQDQRM